VAAVGDLKVETIATGSSIESIDWSPNGQRLAVAIWSGTLGVGQVDVFATNGSGALATYDGTAAAWLDESTIAISASNPDPGARIVVHSLDGIPGVALPRPRYGLLGNDHGLAAIFDTDYAQARPEVSILGHWSPLPASAIFGRWSELQFSTPGWPSRWAPDGRFLALGVAPPETGDAGSVGLSRSDWTARPDPVRLAAASQDPLALGLMRVPSGAIVNTPSLIWDGHVPWLFSPDDSLLVGMTEDGVTLALDTTSGGIAKRLGNLLPDRWLSDGRLVLSRPDETTVVWNPSNDSLSSTSVAADTLSSGPLPGEALSFRDVGNPGEAAVEVRMGGHLASIHLEYGLAPWASSWAPDGSALYLGTATDDAQKLHSSLVRVSVP
jgi:WD40 repeat protein